MKRAWLFVVMSSLLAASLATNVWIFRARDQRKSRSAPLLVEGTALPPLRGTALADGADATIAFAADRPTAIYVFTPQCIWCARNLASIKALARERGAEYRFVGLSLHEEELQEYVARNPLGFPVYSQLSLEIRRAYRLGVTPALIVVSTEGRVLRTWRGAFSGRQASEIESYFRVRLPAITRAARASD
jgi:hypothetical protein